MSEIKALEKLREWSHYYDNVWVKKDGETVTIINSTLNREPNAMNLGKIWRELADEIQAEVDEKYIKSPRCKDGSAHGELAGDDPQTSLRDFGSGECEMINSVIDRQASRIADLESKLSAMADAKRDCNKIATRRGRRISDLEALVRDMYAGMCPSCDPWTKDCPYATGEDLACEFGIRMRTLGIEEAACPR